MFGARAVGLRESDRQRLALVFPGSCCVADASAGDRFGELPRGVARSFHSDGCALGADDRWHRDHFAGRRLVAGGKRKELLPVDEPRMNPQTVGIARLPRDGRDDLPADSRRPSRSGSWARSATRCSTAGRKRCWCLAASPFTFASAYDLSVVPLFVLMGSIARHSGMARELFQSLNIDVQRTARRSCHRHYRCLRRAGLGIRIFGGDGSDYEPCRRAGNAPRRL